MAKLFFVLCLNETACPWIDLKLQGVAVVNRLCVCVGKHGVFVEARIGKRRHITWSSSPSV